MKWLLSFLFCVSASAQFPVIPYVIPSGSSTWYPTNASQTLYYWFDTVPSAFISPRVNTSGGGGIPADGGTSGSLTNWAPSASFAAISGANPLYFVSGGGNSGTTPRWSYNNGVTARYISPVTVKFTNFTVVMVVKMASASTANQGLCNNANAAPWLELDASKITMNCGNAVSGAATIGNNPYIVTWLQRGSTSEIDTNGVLYVTGNSGTVGFDTGNSPYLGQARVNHFTGDCSRFWMWTNILSAGDLSSAITQCKTDFGFP